MKLRTCWPAVAVLLLTPHRAEATYSIVASDMATHQVGGASASCIGKSWPLIWIFGAAPGKGAVVAQSLFSLNGRERDQAIALLNEGKAPADVLTALLDPEYDPSFAERQYGIVNFSANAAAYTGPKDPVVAKDHQGQVGDLVYSVQGNTLSGASVVDDASLAFEQDGCDLADRLLRALEAGGAPGQGDKRCVKNGIPGDSAFIVVVDESGDDYVRLEATTSAPKSPVAELRKKYEQWRSTHACPEPPAASADAGTTEDVDASTADATPSQRTNDAKKDSGGCNVSRSERGNGFALASLLGFLCSCMLLRRRSSRSRPSET